MIGEVPLCYSQNKLASPATCVFLLFDAGQVHALNSWKLLAAENETHVRSEPPPKKNIANICKITLQN